MVVINQRVADEIATATARHRYGIADNMDAVRAAEASSAKKSEEIKEAATARKQELVERAEKEREQAGKPRNDWSNKPQQDDNVIGFGGEDDYEEEPPQQPVSARPVPAPPPPEPPAPKPAPRRRPAFDDDDDYENQNWLR